MNFALECKLTIINTCFKKKTNTRWTWRSPNGETKNEIDYILSNQPRVFQDIGNMHLNYPSGHRIIRSRIGLSNQEKGRAKFANKKNFKD